MLGPVLKAIKNRLQVCKLINVVNDWVERGVKLSYDFVQATKEEEYYQNILQVIGCKSQARSLFAKESGVELSYKTGTRLIYYMKLVW